MTNKQNELFDENGECGLPQIHTNNDKESFLEACRYHDGAYLAGGTVDDMAAADKRFYKRVLKASLKDALLIPLRLPKAIFYCIAVNVVGRFVWPYKKSGKGGSLGV